MIVAGIGLRPGAGAAEIIALVEQAARTAGCRPSLLAVPCFRQNETGPPAAAAALSLDMRIVPRDALQAVQTLCPTRSARAEAATGIAAVAEGCALASCGPDGRLILARIASPNATCAFATGPDIP
jgi:cobalamin biosynthesis protein CbiG